MARKVEEWIGKSDDVAIPSGVKLRIWNRANGQCQICTRKMAAGDIKHYDHIVPLADGGKHSEGNLQIACIACHADKTAGEATDRAKVRSKAKAILGIKRPAGKIPSAPFPSTEKAESRSSKQQLPRRPMFAPAADPPRALAGGKRE